MTIMNWALHPEHAVIVSDTIASHAVSGDPMFAMTKVFVVPHLGLMLSAKGWLVPTMKLWLGLSDSTAARGVDHVAEAAPTLLRHAAAEHGLPLGDDATSITFLFGWSGSASRMIGYAFDSRRNYEGKSLPDAMCLIPPIDSRPPQLWWDMALIQQSDDRHLPPEERENIGGNVFIHELIAPHGDGLPEIRIRDLGRLPHYDEDLANVRHVAA